MLVNKVYYIVLGGLFVLTQPAWSLVVQLNDGINARYREGKVVSNVGEDGTNYVLKAKSLVEIDDKYVVRKNGRVDFKQTIKKWKADKAGGCQLNNIAFTPRWDYYCPMKVVQQGPHSRLKEGSQDVYLAVDFMERYDYFKAVDQREVVQAQTEVSQEVQEVNEAEQKAKLAKEKRLKELKRDGQGKTVLNPPFPTRKPTQPTFTGQLIENLSGEEGTLACRLESERSTISGQKRYSSNPDVCEDVKMKLAPIADNHFKNIPAGRRRAKAFIEWIKPMAQYFQAQTGMPASVIVAQAALETGWGSSYLFRRDNSLFGHSCWSRGHQQSFTLKTADADLSGKGTCARRRPEGGHYLRFKSREDSVIAYLNNLLQDDNNFYNELRSTIRLARSDNPMKPIDYREITPGLKRYAPGGYPRYLERMIRQYDLHELDHNDCQKCLTLAGTRSHRSSAQGTARVSQASDSTAERTAQ